MAVCKLHFHNFSSNASKAFFSNVKVWKASCFYLCPCFFTSLKKDIIKRSVVFEKYPDEEMICGCLDCKKEFFSVTNSFEERCDNYFDDLKKLLIQYFNFNR